MTQEEFARFAVWHSGKMPTSGTRPTRAYLRWRQCREVVMRMERARDSGLIPRSPSEWRWRHDALLYEARSRERRAAIAVWREIEAASVASNVEKPKAKCA